MGWFGALASGWVIEKRGDRSPGGDEAAQVALLADGDRAAFEALYTRYGRPLLAYVREIVADQGVAEEVVQDTFVAAWRGAARFEGRSTVSSWLFAIARRQARDRLRRARPDLAPPGSLDLLPAEDGQPEAAALATATRAELGTALDRLPAHHRECLMLALAWELSGPEIAAILGIPEGTVKSRLHAARRALRSHLRGREDPR